MMTKYRGLLAFAIVLGSIVPAIAQDVVRFGVQPAMQPIFIAKALGFISQIETFDSNG